MRENLPLSTPLTIGVLGTNRTRIQKLAMMGISTIGDLLEYYPRAHEDTTEITPIFQLRASNDIQTARGRIVFIKRERSPKRAMQLVRAVIADASGQVECVWFQQGHLPDLFRTGDDVLISGKLKENYGGVLFSSPKIEKIGTQKHIGRVAAVYPESEIITSQWLREKISLLLGSAAFFEEFLPEEVLLENDLISRSEAIRQIHQPESNEALLAAKKRLAFEELFLIQLIGLKRKLIYQRDGSNKKTAVKMDAELVKKFLSSFKFQATSAQKIAIFEILKDLEKPFPMNRLLQGDVGSGKTLVAITVILQVIKSGFQAIILAPTEVLARQHFALIKKELPNNKVVQQILGRSISAELLIGSTSQKDKIRIKSLLEKGELDFVVGTHALLTDDFSVARLGLVVIDEQHRFGVEQREELKKHNYPHILTMTATPIPRTLALTIFGDQDFSVLDEMPVGRKAVITRIVPEAKRDQAYEFCRSEIAKGNKIFVIAPLVEESEKLDVASATEEYDKWFKKFGDPVALLHGRMKPKEKEEIMKSFVSGKKMILVATSVVEVGVDVPEATVMWIEGAERFGLAQLHQFRGRVGRSDRQSYCFLFSTDGDATHRLRAMINTNDGFKLAEIDLKLRGPGEVFGLRQSGIPDLKMASYTDARLVKMTRVAAEKVLKEDLELAKYHGLGQKLINVEE